MIAGAPGLPLGVDPLIAEAKQRARRRRLLVLVAAGLLAAGLLAFELAASGTGGGVNGAVPWLPTRPSTGPANPPLAAPCTAAQLGATLSVQGATGNLAGGIRLVNRSSVPCALVGRPNLSLRGWRITRWQEEESNYYDPLAPPVGSLRALPPGEHVAVQLWIPGWCRMGPAGFDSQRALVLTAPGGGRIRLHNSLFAACDDVPNGVTVQATRYRPFVPPGTRSSELPLRARIVSAGPHRVNGKRIAGPTLDARAGSWLTYTVVLKNHSGHVFRFGKTCPSYVEGFTRPVAYVLNCQPVGSIGPWKSVRFAMRFRVPRHLENLSALGWSLSPHSFNAPAAGAVVDLR